MAETNPPCILYTAAHEVPDGEQVPIGGGGAICRQLAAEWGRTRPFPFRVIGPSILGQQAPRGADLVGFDESAYAGFCRQFETAITEEILREDPKTSVVLANDISEGPDFRRLAEAGFPIATIYHVDVVAYVAAIYMRGWLKPETTVRWYERLKRYGLPDVLKLVWEKQRDSVRYSRLIIVPSAEMKAVLERCYPGEAAGKIHVQPWGITAPRTSSDPAQVDLIHQEFGVPREADVLITLSRISPEKGQDLLLEAMAEWERHPSFPVAPVWLFLCGDAAFMKGRQYLERLRRLASKLKKTQVRFPGHVTGWRKQAFLASADLYVFPSVHESYGLTLMEALSAGLPAVCLASHGASEIVQPSFGQMVPRGSRGAMRSGLWRAIEAVLAGNERRLKMSLAARRYAAEHRFDRTAAELAQRLLALR